MALKEHQFHIGVGVIQVKNCFILPVTVVEGRKGGFNCSKGVGLKTSKYMPSFFIVDVVGWMRDIWK
jgi:hypothetical protein